EDPKFAIQIDTIPASSNSIKANVRFTYIDSTSNYDTAVTFRLALVEGNVGGNTNVLRKFLINPEGLTVDLDWTYGDFYEVSVDKLIDVPITDPTNLYLVAFVYERSNNSKRNKRIHQVEVLKVHPKYGSQPV